MLWCEFFRAIGFFVSLLLVTHWVACLWLTIGCPNVKDSCVSKGWAAFAGDVHSHTVFTPIGMYTCCKI